jgi:hypothetical protein
MLSPEPPLYWEWPHNGKKILAFDYGCIKLWELSPEDVWATQQPALLPLALLTKGGGNCTMVERVYEGLIANRLGNLLPMRKLLETIS